MGKASCPSLSTSFWKYSFLFTMFITYSCSCPMSKGWLPVNTTVKHLETQSSLLWCRQNLWILAWIWTISLLPKQRLRAGQCECTPCWSPLPVGEPLSFAEVLPRCLQQPGMGQARAAGPEPEWQGLQHPSQHLCLQGVCLSGKLESGVALGLEPRHSRRGSGLSHVASKLVAYMFTLGDF